MNQESLNARLQQHSRQSAERDGANEETLKINEETEEMSPSKKCKKTENLADMSLDAKRIELEKIKTREIDENNKERKNMAGENKHENSAAPIRSNHLDENDIVSFVESPMSASSIPSPCLTSLSPSLSTRADGAHHVTLKGSASFLQIPVATAEL